MGKKYSLLIGMNHINAEHYGGWDGALKQPEHDASTMKTVAENAGFETTLLLSEEGTRENVIHQIKTLSQKAEPDDLVFIYYSGHGGQVPDQTGDEEDGMDETWCLYNGQLIDDELHALWGDFKKGTRIIVISDSCHSGTVTKALPGEDALLSKSMPDEIIMKTFLANKDFYTEISQNVQQQEVKEVKATILLMASCQDEQSSYAFTRDELSMFTNAFHELWKEGNMGTYPETLEKIKEKIARRVGEMQTPNFYIVGPDNQAFVHQHVFDI